MKIRALGWNGLQTIIELLNADFDPAEGYPPYSFESLSHDLHGKDVTIWVLEENSGAVEGAIVCVTRRWGKEIYAIGAKGDTNKNAIEDALVFQAETQARGEGEESLYVMADRKKEIEKWKGRGFLEKDGIFQMVAPLGAIEPIPNLSEPVMFRSLRKGEEPVLVEVVNRSFGWERLQLGCLDSWRECDSSFDEGWVQVAEVSGKVVSAVVAMRDKEYNDYFGKSRAYLGPAATLPEFRGKNIASALTRKAMNFLIERGMESALVYVWSDNLPSLAVLRGLGFETEKYHTLLSKELKKP
jgi:ribosomal protein S18 acetylase RimI-like enzyme